TARSPAPRMTPLRVAVISDIHANYHALDAVLADVETEAPDEIWCLGDLVGYGPRPNRCCRIVAARVSLCLAGNHDLGVLGAEPLELFSPDAATAATWSRRVLEPDPKHYLEDLKPLLRRDDVELYHASPRDPVWDYVLTEEGAAESLALTRAPLVLIGHSHVPLALTLVDGSVAGGVAPPGARRSSASPTRSRRRSARSSSAGCRRSSPPASPTGSRGRRVPVPTAVVPSRRAAGCPDRRARR